MLLIFLSLLVHLNDGYKGHAPPLTDPRQSNNHPTPKQVTERPVRMPELVKAHQEGRVRARARASP